MVATTDTSDDSVRTRRRALTALCVTEVTSYGTLFYAFTVAQTAIVDDTGWSFAAVTAAFSAGQVVGAVAGVPVGRILDRRGPRLVMTAGAVLAVPAMVGIALAQTYLWFLVSWLVAGVSMATLFYPPAFAALTRWYGAQRVRALTVLTLVAGLASTVFAPLTAFLLEHFDWRGTYLVLAGIVAVVVIPAHAFFLRPEWTFEFRPHLVLARAAEVRAVLRSRSFLQLATAMTFAGFAFYAALVALVPLLIARDISTGAAALALGLGGVGQLLGRLGYAPLHARFSSRGRTVIILMAGAVTTLLLGLLPGPVIPLVLLAILAGMARGIFTLLQATVVSDRWGSEHYGTINGVFGAPATIAFAVSPAAGAALAGWLGGYPALFVVLSLLLAAGALLAWLVQEHPAQPGTA